MTSFIGDYPCKIDVKGRFLLPSAIVRQIDTDKQKRFVIRKNLYVRCLDLFPIDEWEKQVQILRSKLNPYNKEHNQFLRGFFKDTAEVIPDANFRILIPKRLLELADIESDIVLSSVDNRIEIWAKQNHESVMPQDEEIANMAGKILGNLDINIE